MKEEVTSLENVLDSLRDGYLEADRRGVITYVNLPFVKELGFAKKEEVLGKLFTFFATQETSEYVFEKYKTLYRTKQLMEPFKAEFCRKDGTTFVGESAVSILFDNKGKVVGARGTVRNITERLKAESEYKKTILSHTDVLDTLQDAYFEADPRGNFTFVNQAFVTDTRYFNKEELIGKNFKRLIARKSLVHFFKEFRILYKTNKPREPFDMIYVTKDGEEFSSEIVVSPILKNGKAVGTRGIIRDISIRVKAEKILRQAKETAEFRAGELATINRVATKVSHSLDLQDILDSVCRELTSIFPVRNTGISLISADKTKLEVIAYYSIHPDEESHQGKVLPLDGTNEVQSMISSKKTIIVRDAKLDPRAKPIHDLISMSYSMTFIIVPLIIRGGVIGFIGLSAKRLNYEFLKHEIELAETLGSQIATAIDNARLHAKTEKALDVAERDLEIGRQIQSGFFPRVIPEVPGWEISTYFKAARQVSGDFYDVFPICPRGCIGFVVADVCDKGVGAALFMVLLRSLIRSYSEQHEHQSDVKSLLHNIALKVNNYIVNIHGQSNMFATIVLGILNLVTNKFYYINGGQDPPVLVDDQGKIKMELKPTGPAFGFSAELSFDVGVIEFIPGDILLAFTDGLTEAKNTAGNFYSEERFLKQVAQKWDSAFSSIKHFEADVLSHIGHRTQFDDITLLALRRVKDELPDSHSFKLKAKMENLPFFRNFVVEAYLLFKVGTKLLESLKLVVDEVCSNLILHGYKNMETGDIYIKVRVTGDEILVLVEDTGHPFDPYSLDPPDLTDDIEERKIGGLGLFFLKELVDDISYKSMNGSNSLTIKLRF